MRIRAGLVGAGILATVAIAAAPVEVSVQGTSESCGPSVRAFAYPAVSHPQSTDEGIKLTCHNAGVDRMIWAASVLVGTIVIGVAMGPDFVARQ